MWAQTTVVSGKVTEAATGSPIPFANVVFTGTEIGTITDFDGNFTLTANVPVDSLEVRYIGFLKRTKPIAYGVEQVVSFQLDEDIQTLGEVVVYAGENPAWPIMRQVVANKKANDKRSLDAFEYEAYTKVEFDVDNISGFLQKWKLVKKVSGVLDSIQQIAGEDGNPVFPIFISEAISRYYYKKDPILKHEHVLKTKVSGVGITDGTLSSQVVGATFQEYNFYQNWLNIVTKEFVSPIADGWRIYYNVFLEDSAYIADDFCYRIDFYPKRPQDLAFTGTMWITKEDFALKRIDASVPKEVNLNFIEKLKIQQDLIQTEAGPWLPEKTRVVVDVSQVLKHTAGFLAKFYISTEDHVINDPKPNKFYLNPVSLDENVRMHDEAYWQEHRHDSLTATELNVFDMIDTLKKISAVKRYMDLAKFAVNGYHKVGPIDIGPYPTFIGNNDVEGFRLGFGGRTNLSVSDKWIVGGHFGYGFEDEEWKYRGYVERILSRQPWTTLRVEHQKEVEQVWLLNQQVEPNGLFYGISRFGSLIQPFMIHKSQLTFYRQMAPGFGSTLRLKQERFNPLFDFQYYTDYERSETSSAYDVSEVAVKLRYAKDELFVVNDNERLSLGTVRWPAFNLEYVYGMPNVVGSDFEYHKIQASIEQEQKMGLLGKAKIKLGGGYAAGNVPYTLLFNPIGNQTPFYVDFAYSMMNYFEFSSDRYVEFRYRHSFEGFVLNTIPLMKRLKLRLIGSANVFYGSLNEKNRQKTVPVTNIQGDQVYPFKTLGQTPYIELGYGVENIFKVISVEAFHRLTHLKGEDVRSFGLKFNIEFTL
ncbi:DUF5686 and carboxypeptidase-like regulatory domain-containing protein [Marinoscillum furvescens]|uniref:DUF5686 and carboxypeptidase-like regulatory domain-containing protein n=1 Tax=Marinoscillum furvescens TaxID=1026 RepID=UPI001475A061|nr:DUF5686 and carboxypeptidase-like regulatory domain-containing protein [Marinoscillum furvescens]